MATRKKTKKKVAKKKVAKTARKASRTSTVGTPASKKRRTTAAARKAKAPSKVRRARRTRDAIMAILEEAKSRGSNAEVIRKHNLSPTTFYSWKRKHGATRRKRSK